MVTMTEKSTVATPMLSDAMAESCHTSVRVDDVGGSVMATEGRTFSLNWTVTVRELFKVMVQMVPVTLSQPLQLMKAEPDSAVAVRATTVPGG
jgi:hypothetical protein